MPGEDERISLFQTLGLSETKAKETLKNEKLSKSLETLIKGIPSDHGPVSSSVGTLIYHVASKMKPQVFDKHHQIVLDYVLSGKLSSELRLNAALDYILKNAASSELNIKEMEEASGVGILITPEQIETEVEKAISSVKNDLLEKRYRYNTGLLMSQIRSNLKWVDGKALKNEVDIQILDLLGPKTDEDRAPPPKAPKAPKKENDEKKAAKKSAKASSNIEDQGAEESNSITIKELMKTKVKFHKPGENYTSDGYVTTPQTDALLKEHLKRTGGRVQTRFPPEPNGILHIGHAKAININFGYADAHEGVCNLRYDDTNPEKEEEKFFIAIKDMVEWLGYKPNKITHSSDNFDQLYEWAKILIKKNLAYICHQKVEDIRGFNPPPSPWRERPIEESLQLFEDMKHGKFDEGEATLRLKLTLEEGKVDPVAYRIKYAAHHRTGDKWCIYPTYDYTHCLCDSIEDITHSLCTKEFQNRRSSYYWLCNALDIYCPVQWEYGRLNVSYGVISKRKIAKLIESGICSDWDDPRLFTLTALRRRGFPPEAINNFVARLGVTGAQMTVDPSMLEASVRSYLNIHAPRCMVVLEPLKIKIRNGSNLPKQVGDVPLFPDDPSKGTRTLSLSSEIYIEKSDFKEVPEKGYRRLSPGQSVGLRYAGIVLNYVKTIGPNEIEVECTPVSEVKSKPKAFIHWVDASSASKITVRLYERLFKHANPEDPAIVPGGFLTDVNPDSLHVLKDSVIDSSVLKGLKTFDKFQFERNGFFSVDLDTTSNSFVFNRTVSLKEDAGK